MAVALAALAGAAASPAHLRAGRELLVQVMMMVMMVVAVVVLMVKMMK